ncbi:hypothetical protein [Streptomyces sp. NPDC055085]
MELTVYTSGVGQAPTGDTLPCLQCFGGEAWRLDFIDGTGIRRQAFIYHGRDNKGFAALDAMEVLAENGVDVSHVNIRWVNR